MPSHLAWANKVIDVLSLDINTPEHEIFQTSMQSLREHDSQTDAEKVSKLLDEYRGNGFAVVGVANTLAALSNGQADDLLISTAPGEIKYDEAEVKKVLAAYSAGEGEPGIDVSEPRLVADAIVKRAQDSAATVTFIEDVSLLAAVGGVGDVALPNQKGDIIPEKSPQRVVDCASRLLKAGREQ
ncbi:MAG TPA: hypothetical protein VF762_12290 [Blastocatellia bacterium]